VTDRDLVLVSRSVRVSVCEDSGPDREIVGGGVMVTEPDVVSVPTERELDLVGVNSV
jgi:hypothetical protein